MRDKFTLSGGQSAKLETAIDRNGGETTDVEWLCAGDNFRLVMSLARGEAELTFKAKPAPEPEPVIDPVVHVDRSIRPSYPDWMKEVIHPELENVGPAEYDISGVERWLHDGQKGGKYIEGTKIYAHLKETGMIKSCHGLRDLEEIQKKGIAFFRKYFKGKAVFGWAGIVRCQSGRLFVPCLCEHGGMVVLRWGWVGRDFGGSSPALRHAS